jgi:adenine-specific DNA methylase
MKTFIAIVKCQHCGQETPAVINRIEKAKMNLMNLKNECNKCDKLLNDPNEQGVMYEIIKAPRGILVDDNNKNC